MMTHKLAGLILAVQTADRPSRELDRAIWHEIEPKAARCSDGGAPFFTDDPRAAKSILPATAVYILSENAGSEFLATVLLRTASGEAMIEARHRHRFLAACLVALQARAYASDDAGHR